MALRLLSSSLKSQLGQGLPAALPLAACALMDTAMQPGASVQQARAYRAVGLHWSRLPASAPDLPKVKELLKRETQLTPVFSPHGFALLPIGVARGSLIAHPSPPPNLDEEAIDDLEDKEEQEEPSIQAIGIKTWRRLKMKKHKINKRRKASRHKTRKV